MPPVARNSRNRRTDLVVRRGSWLSRLHLLLLGLGVACEGRSADLRAPTYNSEVAPILAAHCVQCHRAGQIAEDIDLSTYETVRPHAAAISQQVRDHTMPPWPANSEQSLPFRNDASLDAATVNTLVAWANADAPLGKGTSPTMKSEGGWLHPDGRPPDAVLTLPAVNVPANGKMPYVPLRIEVPLAADKWITAMQVKPGNSALVHHMGITEVEVSPGLSASQIDGFRSAAQRLGIPADALDNSRPAVRDPVNPEVFDMLGIYTPGSTFEMYPPGAGKLLKGGGKRYINFNVHYTTNGVAQQDRSQLALWFLDRPPSHQLLRAPMGVASLIANGRELLTDDPGTKAEGTDVAIPPIPKNSENYELIGMTAFTAPVTIYQVQPHAHMRAKDFTYRIIYPDGHERTVLTVPRYDFHWQLAYDLQVPLALPAGSKLIVTAHYDNSLKNPHLKTLGEGELARNCGPDKEAYFRRENQSWDEMFSPLVQYSNIVTARRLPTVEVVGCSRSGGDNHDWWLVHAGSATMTKLQSTSAAALMQCATKPLGSDHYRLVGIDPFDRQLRSGQRVAVRGVMINTTYGRALNVTSLQSIPGTCP